MNPNPLGPATDPLQQYLSELPQPDCPDDLWPRIQHSRQRRRQRRRLLAGVGMAAAIAVVAALPHFLLPDVAPTTAVPTSTALPHSPALRAIDRRLQAAYDQGANAEQIEALWRARELVVTPTPLENERDDAILRL